jgi:hypothetical protein
MHTCDSGFHLVNKHCMGWGGKSKGCLMVIVEMGEEDAAGETFKNVGELCCHYLHCCDMSQPSIQENLELTLVQFIISFPYIQHQGLLNFHH